MCGAIQLLKRPEKNSGYEWDMAALAFISLLLLDTHSLDCEQSLSFPSVLRDNKIAPSPHLHIFGFSCPHRIFANKNRLLAVYSFIYL